MDSGFLNPWWNDVMALAGLFGAALTIVAVGFTLYQTFQAKSAARAAENAAQKSYNMSRDRFRRYILGTITRALSETKLLVDKGDYDKAKLRLQDLAEKMSQLKALGDTTQDWNDLTQQLQEWERTFTRLVAGELQFKTVRAKWDKTSTNLSQAINELHSPYNEKKQDTRYD